VYYAGWMMDAYLNASVEKIVKAKAFEPIQENGSHISCPSRHGQERRGNERRISSHVPWMSFNGSGATVNNTQSFGWIHC
jgi:hypothetical protein